MLTALFVLAASVYIGLAVASFILSRTGRLVGAFWSELLSVIPAGAALTTLAIQGSAGWVLALWVFNGAMSVLSAWFMSKRIQHEAEHRAWAERFLR